MRYTVQFFMTVEVDAKDGREAVPAAVSYLQAAMEKAREQYVGDMIKGVEWRAGILSSVGE